MRLGSEKCGFGLVRVAGYARYAGSVRTGSERVCVRRMSAPCLLQQSDGSEVTVAAVGRSVHAGGGGGVPLVCVCVVLSVRRVCVVLRCVALVVRKVVCCGGVFPRWDGVAGCCCLCVVCCSAVGVGKACL